MRGGEGAGTEKKRPMGSARRHEAAGSVAYGREGYERGRQRPDYASSDCASFWASARSRILDAFWRYVRA